MFAKNQYNEGVHAPGVTKVFLSRTTNSDIVFFEQIGRALSTKGNIVKLTQEYEHMTIQELKEIANSQGINILSCKTKEEIIERLLAPTIIDLVGNIEFIKELKDNLIGRIKERQKRGIPTKITKELIEVSFDIEIENEDLYEILQNIKDKVSNLTWEEWYKQAQEYYEKNGDLQVSQSYATEEGLKLGTWISNQRKLYKSSELELDKISKLESIGMVWNIKNNKENIVILCNEYGINYKLNKKYLDRLSYSIFKIVLTYFIYNNIRYIDSNGMLISDFYMSSKDCENKYGISYQDLISKEKRM